MPMIKTLLYINCGTIADTIYAERRPLHSVDKIGRFEVRRLAERSVQSVKLPTGSCPTLHTQPTLAASTPIANTAYKITSEMIKLLHT